jgi:glycosyltransferase involved in cell wall biosynthesis
LAEQKQKRIQYLLLSDHNVGKPAAWNWAFAAAPGEFVAYADSDVYFYPGWLQASLAALKAFPKAGMVTAMPMLTPEKYSTSTTKWAKKQRNAKVEHGRLLPWEDFWRHARSLGDSEERAREFYEGTPAVRVSAKGKRYFIGAAHFQFTARKAALMELLPIPADRPMGRVRLLDEAMNAAGYLRLTTEQWYVQHLGNVVPQPGDLVSDSSLPVRPGMSRKGGIWSWGPIRKVLQWLYGWSFNRLHRGE